MKSILMYNSMQKKKNDDVMLTSQAGSLLGDMMS